MLPNYLFRIIFSENLQMKNYLYLVLIILPALLFVDSCKPKVNASKEHFNKANDFLFKEDFVNARKEYEIAIKADTNNWQACYELAGIYELEGDFKNAYYYFSKTIQLNPKFALGYY